MSAAIIILSIVTGRTDMAMTNYNIGLLAIAGAYLFKTKTIK
jgi:hypothetical protein